MSVNNKRSRSFFTGWSFFFFLFSLAGHAAESSEDVPPATSVVTPPGTYNGYASAALGNGVLYGHDVATTKPMRWRAAEIRFGPNLDIFGLVSSGRLSAAEAPRLDIVYYNEGHPDNNHRDGYALQMVFRKKIQPYLNIEFGAGPYFSMNRTTAVSGVESDDARVGALFSLALLASLDHYSPGLSLRVGYNHVIMPGAPSSDALIVGIGKEFDTVVAYAPDQPGLTSGSVWLAGSVGFAQTNQSGPGKRLSYAIDAKKYYGHWAISVSGVDEGSDGVRVDRRGIAAQAWYVQSISENWGISFGAGPYFAANQREFGNWTTNGLMTLEVDRNIGKNFKAFIDFGRVVTFRNKNDADLLTLGISRKFDF
ncbi:hypothetical protein [Glaciimonas sp. PCH181]|uniref:hypothetical protein n=1 Tax=Glaciimonas sp. PCH181 TaxID=2133943 RepID=UPI000D367C1A|nr:hypothetical protein [Glaciimonas sp. PCH181]PUA18502.1 hypothetical protein C7W93_00610 [Glaciimonas sp. PCH181]